MAEEKVKGEVIGEVFTYFSKVSVAGIKLSGTLKVGDKIRIKGHTTDIEMKVDSMQIEREEVQEAKTGDSIGIKVPDKVRGGDKVCKVVSEGAECACCEPKAKKAKKPKKKRGRPKKKK